MQRSCSVLMACTVGFRAIFSIPQTSELLGTDLPSLATKLHEHITTGVLSALMLTLSEAESNWLQIDVQAAKLPLFNISRHMLQSDWATVGGYATKLDVQMSQ
ncbi:hypothetical protein ABBQ38_008593 [Trebouxia sp. C0009 RCD-2024]